MAVSLLLATNDWRPPTAYSCLWIDGENKGQRSFCPDSGPSAQHETALPCWLTVRQTRSPQSPAFVCSSVCFQMSVSSRSHSPLHGGSRQALRAPSAQVSELDSALGSWVPSLRSVSYCSPISKPRHKVGFFYILLTKFDEQFSHLPLCFSHPPVHNGETSMSIKDFIVY